MIRHSLSGFNLLLAFGLMSVVGVSNSTAQTLSEQLLPLMENTGNPLIQLSSSEGDLFIELFPDAAPLSVRRVLDLASGRLMPNSNGGNYYDGLTFHRVIPGVFLQTGAAERAGRDRPPALADEINARGLGLEQQTVLNAAGRPHEWMNIADTADFQQRVLVPLYRNMNIRSREQAEAQQDRITDRLRTLNIMQVHELLGYRYNPSLPSRRPLAGSVLMANNGPGTNDAELLISLIDSPWLTATHTVIGRVIAGSSLANSISRQPEGSVRVYQIRPVEILMADRVQLPTAEGTNNASIQP